MNDILSQPHRTPAPSVSCRHPRSSRLCALASFLRTVCLWTLLTTPVYGGNVIINEIMFHPSSHLDDDEYLELHNIGNQPADLLDWRFDRGVSFVFTNHVVIPPNGFLVVAARVQAFQAAHPTVTNLIGDWSGSLANSGESIRLVDAAGQTSDEVRYADSGDFALRTEFFSNAGRGWTYFSSADGLGYSLERKNPSLPGAAGANWGTSLSIGGTPGQANTVQESSSAPVILNLTHAPAIPRPTEPVTVTAEIQTVPGESISSVSLFYRTVSSSKPGSFIEIPMADDGSMNDGLAADGRWGVVLPELPHRTVVEFYVQASSAAGRTRTYPPPARDRFGVEGQYVNALYQVDNSSYQGNQPVYSLVLTETDRISLANLPQVDPSSDIELHTTFISRDGSDYQIRYGCGVRLRGASSRFMNPPNYRVSIPSDRRWKGVTGINLNLLNVHSQIAGYALATRAGLVTEEHRPVQVRVNGGNLATSASPPLGLYAHAEVPDGAFAEHHFPEDPDGNVYRASSRGHSATLDYLGDDPARYQGVGYSKTTHQSENDWSDLIRLTQALASFGDADYLSRVKQSVNIPQWLTYFAVFNLIGSTETSLGTGVGDDYAMYRGVKDPRFQLIGHDWDSVLGEEGSAPVEIFQTAELPSIDRLLKHPEVAPLYYAELLRQIQGPFSPAEVARTLDENLTPWTPAATILNMKRFATNRVASFLNQIPTELKWRGGTTVANLGSVLRFNTNNILLWGTAHAANTRQVVVNGTASQWTASSARWTNRLVLNYGLSRLQIQAFDAQGTLLDSTNAAVWVAPPTSTALSGVVTTNRSLKASGSPYRVTNEWRIADGATLSIEPGVTILFAPGGRLTIDGRLEAVGTADQPIFLSKDPDVVGAGIWQGIEVTGAGSSLRLSHVSLIGAGLTGANIRAQQARLELDHLTLLSALNIGLDAEDSSLELSDSIFPGDGLTQAVRAQRIPANGKFVLSRNLFNKLISTNAVVSVTDARLPHSQAQIVDNNFLGGADDLVQLANADAYLEGNLFARAKGEATRPNDLASAVTVIGDESTPTPVTATLLRNRFLSNDHGIVVRNGARITAAHNTFQSIGFAAVAFDEPLRRAEGATPGKGAIFSGNIVWSTPTNFLYTLREDPEFGTTELVVEKCLLSGLDIPVGSADTLTENPRFADTRATLTTVTALRNSVELLPGSPALGAGPGGRDIGATARPGLSIRGQPTGTTPATSAQGVIEGIGYSQYRFQLDSNPVSGPIDLSVPITLAGLTSGTHQVKLQGQKLTGEWDRELVLAATWTVDPAASPVILSELLARNRTAFLQNGIYPDVIELQNRGLTPVDLNGMGLTDDPQQPQRFTFPPQTVLAPGGYLIVLAVKDRGTPLSTGFSLNASGGQLMLFPADATNGPPVDRIDYGPQATDFSIARMEDGVWTLAVPTPGLANQRARIASPSRVVINEWLADGTGEDFIELYNSDALPAPLGGLSLTDDDIAYPARHTIASLSFIDGLGLQVFTADGNVDAGPNHLGFRLSADGGTLSLHGASSETIDCFLYQSQVKDTSQGRSPNGATRIGFFSEPTPGAPNPAPAPPFAREIRTYSTNIISMTNHFWKYREDNVDLATAWRQPDYDDTAWPIGIAPFGVEDCDCLPEPIKTPLALLQPDGLKHVRTYYFRTTFELPSLYASNSTFTANVAYNDGAAIYVNGRLISRLNMPLNFSHDTFASSPVSLIGRSSNLPVAATNLVLGFNTIAVEVHQGSELSDDVVMEFALRADRSVTNFLSTQKVLLNEVLAHNQTLTNSDGSITDWVELYNPSPTQPTDLAGMSLSDSADNPRRWIFPTGATIAPGGFRVIRLTSDLPSSTVDETELNAGFALKSEGDRLLLFDAPASGGGLLDGITFGLQATDFSIGRYSTAGAFWELNIPSPGAPNLTAQLDDPAGLKINEWMAAPASGDDWFELYNPSLFPVDLGGLYLSDTPGLPTLHRIPPLSFIGTGTRGAYRQMRADGSPDKGADHVNFKLSAGGEVIGLYRSDGATPLDLVTFGPQDSGTSEGRLPDGGPTIVRFPRSPSPGSLNTIPFADVTINEVITRRATGGAIELQNTSEYPQHIGGWWLSTDERNPRQFRIADHTILPAGGYRVFDAATLSESVGGAGTGLVLLPGQVQTIYLSGVTTGGALSGLRSQMKVGVSEPDQSAGLWETSLGFDSPLMSVTTLGASNSAPRVGPVVINEIHYHPKSAAGAPETDEFIELFNLSNNAVNLYSSAEPTNTWHLRNAVDYNFPGGVTLGANSFLIVVGFDPATNVVQTASFRSRFGIPATVTILGPWIGRLDNSGDTVELNYPTSPIGSRYPRALMDWVSYTDLPPWATAADGQGNGLGTSLQRRSALGYGNEPTNWVAAVPTAGLANKTPTSTPPTITVQPSSRNTILGQKVTFSASVTGTGPLAYQWRHNGLDLLGATNSNLVLTNVGPSDEGVYTMRVSNAAGAARSGAARLTLNRAPLIVRQPEGSVTHLGATIQLSVGFQGTAPVSIQWSRNGNNLLNETNPILALIGIKAGQLGGYQVTLTNAFGKAVSSPAILEVETAPTLLSQPQPEWLRVNESQRAVLVASVGGSSPLRFQWRRNGQPVRNATNQNFAIEKPRLEDSGVYTLLAANTAGSITSSPARIDVRVAPTINVTAPPIVLKEGVASKAEFLLTRTGTNDIPFDVQLDWSGSAIAGQDYQQPPSRVSLPAGINTLAVSVDLINDGLRESAEQIQLTLLASPEYRIGTNRTASVSLEDDENRSPVLLSITPEANAHFPLSPTNIVLEVDASDPDPGDGVTNVVLVANNNLILGEWATPPYRATWTNPPVGSNTIVGMAIDQLGAMTVKEVFSFYVNRPPQASIQQPNEGDFFNAGTPSIPATASGFDLDGEIASIAFYLETNLLATLTNAPYTIQMTKVPNGHHVLRVIATDREGQPSLPLERRFSVGVRPTTMTDVFRARGLITGTNVSSSGSNLGATTEAGEPTPVFDGGIGRSLWIEWVAPVDGLCTVDTLGSRSPTGSALDTVLGVYQGQQLNLLWEYISDDDGAFAVGDDLGSSLVRFRCEAGVSYQFRVSAYASGTVRLNVKAVAEAATTISGDAVEAPDLPWRTRATSPWALQKAITSDNVDALRIPDPEDNSATWVETTIEGPALLNFQWRMRGVSAVFGATTLRDRLIARLNGTQVLETTRQGSWVAGSLSVPPGPQTVRWTYLTSFGVGDVATREGFLDQVKVLKTQLGNIQFVSPSVIGVEVRGTKGTAFTLESSEDLVNWKAVSTGTFDTSGTALLSITNLVDGLPKQFLRSRQGP